MTFAVGALVRARGREWVVLPESTDDLLMVRPLGGAEDEVTGIYRPLEPVEPAHFGLPDPADIGDHRSCRLLRDAVRLGLRSSAGPFRSFARIAVEPRPYQLVPLLMALRLDPVRLLIADDVGIGKTVEAGLIARELIDRGEARRLAVLCPPHLAEQWQRELSDKFHIEAELVLPSTATRLERGCRADESVFDRYPHVVVSIDYIKADRRRDDFLRACPSLVIIDEAHTCADGGGRGARHQRHQLIRDLAADPHRHVLLVTATPHSGNESAFRSLLTFLDPGFATLPEDVSGPQHEGDRRRLARHFVQRRRGDLRRFLEEDTPFPRRLETEESYHLSADYRSLFDRALEYARERVDDEEGGQHRQRVRWWSALALLRSLTSSPRAAEATLRNRAAVAVTGSVEEADEVGRRAVLDIDGGDTAEVEDVPEGADISPDDAPDDADRRRLLDMARAARKLEGKPDEKLQRTIRLVKELLRDGFRPLVFCRFIPTAEYVAEQLSAALPNTVTVAAVTGQLPPAERETRVHTLAAAEKRVLVATDCLSEGINLQEHFDAVLHYDLSWNPTRHEQREGRVDRYGQSSPDGVRVVTLYGADNPVDGVVLDVLIRKHKTIRTSLGYSVPVPVETDQVVEALFAGLLLRGRREQSRRRETARSQLLLPLDDKPGQTAAEKELFARWDDAAARQKRSQTMFAQHAIRTDEVRRELTDVRAAIGAGVDVSRFLSEAVTVHGGIADPIESRDRAPGLRLVLDETPRALRDRVGVDGTLVARFDLPVAAGERYLERTHPTVEAVAGYVLDTALDPLRESPARRAGAIRTSAVDQLTTLLVVRLRYHIVSPHPDGERPLLAEDCVVLGFEGVPEAPRWLDDAAVQPLLQASATANVAAEQARAFVQRVVGGFAAIAPHVEQVARQRGDALLDAHTRVRQESKALAGSRVEPVLPPDVLGIYLYLPAITAL